LLFKAYVYIYDYNKETKMIMLFQILNITLCGLH